jgi:hypothetical protein
MMDLHSSECKVEKVGDDAAQAKTTALRRCWRCRGESGKDRARRNVRGQLGSIQISSFEFFYELN